MKKQDYLLLNDVKGYERLYLTLARDEQLREGQFTQVYTWYRANALTCGFDHHMSRQDFCDCLANTQEKPYASAIQTIWALELLQWNINAYGLGDEDQSWAPTAYSKLERIWGSIWQTSSISIGLAITHSSQHSSIVRIPFIPKTK